MGAQRRSLVARGVAASIVILVSVLASIPARSAPVPVSLTFGADADTSVRGDSPTSTGGAATTMTVDGSPDRRAYLRFVVSGVNGAPVERAVLTLFCTDSSPDAGSIRRTLSSTWSEASVTYATKPGVDATILASVGRVTSGTTVSIDLTSTIVGDGTYSFEIATPNADAAAFRTKEATTGFTPKLVVTYAGPDDTVAPTTSVTSPSESASVTSTVPLTADATDDNGISLVTFLVDGRTVAVDPTAPFSATWNSRTVRNGPHTIGAIARDAAGNTTSATPVDVTVDNTPLDSFVFTAAGDHGANAQTALSLAALDRSGATYDLALGDLDYGEVPTEAAWCDYVKERLPTLGPEFPIELVSGNHEQQGGSDHYILNYAPCLPDRMNSTVAPNTVYPGAYFFDYPKESPLVRTILIPPSIMLEGYAYTFKVGTSEYAWLSSTIDDARTAGIPWIVVGMHEVCLTAGVKSCSVGADLMNLLVSKRVDLVLQGHDHNYQRSHQLALDPITCPKLAPQAFDADCVANSGADGQYVKGGGTVFVIDGVFGKGTYAVNPADVEAPYFAAMDSTSFGFTRYTVTRDAIQASFVATTGSFQDPFTIGTPPPPAPDVEPPSTPTGLTASATTAPEIDLRWTASTDDVGVSDYVVYRDGAPLKAVPDVTYRDTSVAYDTQYTYTVIARDAAGRESSPSDPVVIRTPKRPTTTTTFVAVADAWVRSDQPNTNVGSGSSLSVDAKPIENTYLRFTVSGIGSGGTVTRAILRLTCNNASNLGGTVYRVTGPWSETGVTWNTRPPFDATPIASLPAVKSSTTYDVDVTSLITGDGTYDIQLSSTSTDGAGYKARTTSSPPRLIVSSS